jgi:hypothetical protein
VEDALEGGFEDIADGEFIGGGLAFDDIEDASFGLGDDVGNVVAGGEGFAK